MKKDRSVPLLVSRQMGFFFVMTTMIITHLSQWFSFPVYSGKLHQSFIQVVLSTPFSFSFPIA